MTLLDHWKAIYLLVLPALSAAIAVSLLVWLAGALLMTLPVIAIFFFAQHYFLRGVTLTGIKG